MLGRVRGRGRVKRKGQWEERFGGGRRGGERDRGMGTKDTVRWHSIRTFPTESRG